MDVQVLQTDMTEEMQDSVCDFIVEGFRKKIEYEDIAKYCADTDNDLGVNRDGSTLRRTKV